MILNQQKINEKCSIATPNVVFQKTLKETEKTSRMLFDVCPFIIDYDPS
jgi:hypothetical protein